MNLSQNADLDDPRQMVKHIDSSAKYKLIMKYYKNDKKKQTLFKCLYNLENPELYFLLSKMLCPKYKYHVLVNTMPAKYHDKNIIYESEMNYFIQIYNRHKDEVLTLNSTEYKLMKLLVGDRKVVEIKNIFI